jgi:hypothetical protein
MDIAINLDKLVPQAKYRGSLVENTQEAYESLSWEDAREKPDWSQIIACNNQLQLDLITKHLKTLLRLKKQAVAYGGYKFIKNGQDYCFGTAKEDIGMILSTVMSFNSNLISTIDWKCNDNKFVTLDKAEFLNLYAQGTAFVNEQFNKEKTFLEEVEDAELTDEFVADFKARVEVW